MHAKIYANLEECMLGVEDAVVCVGAAAPIIFSSAPVTSGSLLLFVILHVVNSIETMTANDHVTS